MGNFKGKHGESLFSAFIEKARKIVPSVAVALPQLASGNFVGAMITVGDKLSESVHKNPQAAILLHEFELRKQEFELDEMKEITKRWDADMVSDSWLSKNVRPLTLIYLTLSATILMVLDSSIKSFVVGEEWILMLKVLLTTVYLAYFGSRGVEKYKKMTQQ